MGRRGELFKCFHEYPFKPVDTVVSWWSTQHYNFDIFIFVVLTTAQGKQTHTHIDSHTQQSPEKQMSKHAKIHVRVSLSLYPGVILLCMKSQGLWILNGVF